MSQNLKKESCSGKCYPRCPIYNILQRRIGNWQIIDQTTIEGMTRYIQKERCPEGMEIETSHLNPSQSKYCTYRIW